MEEDFLDLENETIAIVNSTYHETVVHIGKINFSERRGYYSNAIIANVSDWEWGRVIFTQEIYDKWIDDIDFADNDYKQMMMSVIFEGEEEATLRE